MPNPKEGGAFLITQKPEGHTPQQPYSCQIDHYPETTSCLQDEHLDMTTAIERAAIELHLARGRADSLLRSVSVLDEWLEDNEGKIADEVRVRRVKHWREEALEQLRHNS